MQDYIDLNEFQSAQEYASRLIEFIEKYSFLWRHDAVNFFVLDYWGTRFPDEWKILESVASKEDLMDMASFGIVKAEYPESLVEFVKTAKSIGLNRDPKKDPKTRELLKNSKKLIILGTPLDKRLEKSTPVKKRHEIQEMSGFVAQICNDLGIKKVVDIGSGQGFLDMSLCYQYGLDVLCIDDDRAQTANAITKSEKFKKQFKNSDFGKIYCVNTRMDHRETFSSIISSELGDTVENSEWLLTGLHACGDLTVNILRQFINGPAKAVAVVGCCYNHVTETEDLASFENRDWELSELWTARKQDTIEPGFPLSEYCKGVKLGFTPRMLATQSIHTWRDSMQEAILYFSKHSYRALLQLFLVEMNIIDKDTKVIVGRLPRRAFRNGFPEYALAAMTQMKLERDPTILMNELIEFDRIHSKKVGQIFIPEATWNERVT